MSKTFRFKLSHDDYLNVPCIKAENVPVEIMRKTHRVCTNNWMGSEDYKQSHAACVFVESYHEEKGKDHEPGTGKDDGHGFILISLCAKKGKQFVKYLNKRIAEPEDQEDFSMEIRHSER